MHLCFVYLTLKIFCNDIEKIIMKFTYYMYHTPIRACLILVNTVYFLQPEKKSAIKGITLTHTNYSLLFVNKWLIFTLRHADDTIYLVQYLRMWNFTYWWSWTMNDGISHLTTCCIINSAYVHEYWWYDNWMESE